MKVKRILLIAHDAGGANILSALMKKYEKKYQWSGCVEGPAQAIFDRKDFVGGHQLNQLFDLSPDLVLTATSWGSTLEIDAIKKARQLGIPTASFLDHWCNYRARFGSSLQWKKNLPDYILTGDAWAYQQAVKESFPRGKLHKVENPYWANMRDQIKNARLQGDKKKKTGRINVLYLSSPIADHARKEYGSEHHWGFNEYDQVEDLLAVIDNQQELNLCIRLHPSENRDKYARFFHPRLSISFPSSASLVDDCMKADVLIGCDTLALVVGLLTGGKVISYFKGKKLKSTLPQQEIIKVFSTTSLVEQLTKLKNARISASLMQTHFKMPGFPRVLMNLR